MAPAIVLSDDPREEIVQEETFGPVLVVQRAAHFDEALELLNGVRQGLVAALFSAAPERRARFLAEARAGILKLGQATADAGVDQPFGGFKASGIGPPEHGDEGFRFFTRPQAIYD
jgi:acyl-CoA reductase-like NAD-dependent aldehyde dehydrogenase